MSQKTIQKVSTQALVGAAIQGDAIPQVRASMMHSQTGASLASQWLGHPLPALKAGQPRSERTLRQEPISSEPRETASISQLLEERRMLAGEKQERKRRKDALLALLEEWLQEPDDIGEEEWREFEEELARNRFRLPDRDLP